MENITENTTVMTTKDWLKTILITAIPFVGFIMLFIWAFGDNTNLNKKNWATATLLWMLILIVLNIALMIMFGVMFSGNIN